MATVVGTPSNLDSMGADTLRRVALETRLRKDSIRPSMFTELKTESKYDSVSGKLNIIKSGIMMDVSNIGNASAGGGQSVVVGLSKPLQMAPDLGTDNDPLGNEESIELFWTRLYYNEIKKSVKYYKWGYYKNDTSYLNYIDTHAPALATYNAEYRDTRIQQALLTGIGDELAEAPVNKTRIFNKNFIIPNSLEADYPSYDTDAGTWHDGSQGTHDYYGSRYEEAGGATDWCDKIAASMLAASGVGSTSKALLNVDTIVQIMTYIKDQLIINPITVDGKPTVVLAVPTRVKGYLMNPNLSGTIGYLNRDIASYKDPERMIIPGEFGRLGDFFLLVENFRAPTLTVGGSAGSYTLTPGYLNPGNVDNRNNSAWSNSTSGTNYVFDVAFALGENALAEYTKDPFATDMHEQTQYGKIEGRLGYLGQGIQIPMFDKDASSVTDTSSIQKGSAVIPVSRTSIEAID